MAFADYIVFADESGSPVLDGIDPDYPIFVLACVLVRKSVYADAIVPALQRLKFKYLGHDQIVLHERDIRRQSNDFSFLQVDPETRETFLADLTTTITNAEMKITASVIHKAELRERYADPWSPYEVALHLCMERLLAELTTQDQRGTIVHVVFESRGKNEDQQLELHFRRIANNQVHWGFRRPDFSVVRWEPLFVAKGCNSSGLQLADLVARPLGLKALRPRQSNRTFEVLEPKLLRNGFVPFP